MNISDHVRKAMAEANVSAYEIANKNNGRPSEQAIKNIASGETKSPGIRIMVAIGEATGRTVSQLIGEAEPPRQIQREPRTWDDLSDCLDALGIVDTESVLRLVKQLPRSKDSGKRQLG